MLTGMASMAGKLDSAKFNKFDIAFARRIWSRAGNEYLAKTLEEIAFRIFVFQNRKHDQGN